MAKEEAIAWIDVETTGVEAADHFLLEVACLVTDSQLNVLEDKGFQAEVFYDATSIAQLKALTSDYVIDMHTKTGLWDRLESGTPMDQLDDELHAYISGLVPEVGTAWLGGNSVKLDRDFINMNLPKSAGHLLYRSVDVTSFAFAARHWYGLEFSKKLTHSAFSDIRESIDELRFYRENILK